MNKAIFNFPKSCPITCTWVETGDPKQPLVRVWKGARNTTRKTANPAMATAEVEGIALCA